MSLCTDGSENLRPINRFASAYKETGKNSQLDRQITEEKLIIQLSEINEFHHFNLKLQPMIGNFT
jgi:hypothetical protein